MKRKKKRRQSLNDEESEMDKAYSEGFAQGVRLCADEIVEQMIGEGDKIVKTKMGKWLQNIKDSERKP